MKKWRHVTGLLVVFGILTAVIFASQAEGVALNTHSPLLTTNRSNLHICVTVIGGNSRDLSEARSAVQTAMAEMAMSGTWQSTPYRDVKFLVDSGCGKADRLVTGGRKHPKDGGKHMDDAIVSTPSKYRTMVFVVADSGLAPQVKNLPVRTSPEEFLCDSEDSCAEVTTGLYLTLDETRSQTILKDALMDGLGLRFPSEQSRSDSGK